ncbi:PQQ-dependent sugar dehydrogenase [Sphingobacterium sp. R2]|uniref:PQQ-dependent sugar dehydrogenase n=1 Tax=Sphingobacterium sp. R2 TaxID=3112958 RepID=UPI00345D964C
MKTKLTISLLTVSLGLTACNSSPASSTSGSDSSANAPVDTTSYPAVETQKANTNYKPAFAGQTRIQGVKTTTPYEGKVIAEGLKSPWGITAMPDGRLLISEKEGDFRIATKDGELSEPIKGLPPVNSSGQGGLLGVRLDPNFESNRMVYWVFSDNTAAGTLTAVAKGKLSADEKSIEGAKVIYQATPAHKGNLHYGGRIIFDKNGNIIVSTGERSDLVTRPLAQDLNAALGKILRITTDGQPAQGNPFLGNSNARPEIFSYGHRNPQGLAIHPETGDLWETEFGPRGGDELNRIESGKNYGWPTITYGIEYKGDKVGEGIQQKDGLEQPVYYWDPVLSPSGIAFYTGQNIPEWKNNLFICGLSSMHIARIILKDNKVVGEERLLGNEGQRFRDITQGKDGALYAITDLGKLYKIDKK